MTDSVSLPSQEDCLVSVAWLICWSVDCLFVLFVGWLFGCSVG